MSDTNGAGTGDAPPSAPPPAAAATKAALFPVPALSGAVGAGLVLVVLPSLALLGLGVMPQAIALCMSSTIVLATAAIFGIMILLGALSLVSTLFARLDLADRREPLGLPAGSIRAFIALALVVLFALISVMLYESMGETYRIDDLTDAERQALVKDAGANHVTAIVAHPCVASAPPTCVPLSTVYVRQPAAAESTDLAKQLLILIGTLMTSVTSFYFASRSSEATTRTAMTALASHLAGTAAPDDTTPAPPPPAPAARAAPAHAEDGAEGHPDGCDVAIDKPTPDEELPPSTGGVAS